MDITQEILKALNEETLWSVSEFYEVKTIISNHVFTVSFWEGDEKWASIGFNNQLIGYIWSSYPLIIIKKPFINNIKRLLSKFTYINFINAESFSDEIYLANSSILQKTLIGFDISSFFSLEDFIFYTN